MASSLSVRLPEDLLARAKAYNTRTGVPVSEIVRRAVGAWLRLKEMEMQAVDAIHEQAEK